MVREATCSDPPLRPPDTLMREISRATFSVEINKILNIIWKRMASTEEYQVLHPLKSMILLEYIIVEGNHAAIMRQVNTHEHLALIHSLCNYPPPAEYGGLGLRVREQAHRLLRVIRGEQVQPIFEADQVSKASDAYESIEPDSETKQQPCKEPQAVEVIMRPAEQASFAALPLATTAADADCLIDIDGPTTSPTAGSSNGFTNIRFTATPGSQMGSHPGFTDNFTDNFTTNNESSPSAAFVDNFGTASYGFSDNYVTPASGFTDNFASPPNGFTDNFAPPPNAAFCQPYGQRSATPPLTSFAQHPPGPATASVMPDLLS